MGLLVVLYAQPTEANYPGTNGKIYYSGDGQDFQIYSIDPDGGSNVRVTQNQSGNWEPAYSPTGKKVAYRGWDGNDWEIYTADLDGEAGLTSPTTTWTTATLTTHLTAPR